MSKIITFIISIIIPFIAAAIGSAATITKDDSWYGELIKPAYNPPGWVFGLVWNPLYILIGISLYLFWTSRNNALNANRAIVAFATQLTLNAFWSLVFFGLENVWGGVIINLLLLGAIMWNMKEFWRFSKWSTYLLVPYLTWTIFANLLNINIALLN